MKTPGQLPEPGSIVRLNEIAGVEVDLAFGAARFHEKAIGSVRFKLARTGVGHPGTHPRNALAVEEPLGWRDIGVADQMPQGRREFVSLEFIEQKHLDRGQLVMSVEEECEWLNLRCLAYGLD